MSAKINHFKIGLFTVIGIGLFIAGLFVFGAWTNLEKKSVFETYVAGDVSGLSVGSAVELRGVRVGNVTGISFSWNDYQDTPPGYVVVVFEMNDSVSFLPAGPARIERLQTAIDRGLRARPKAQGVTGTCIVSLEYVDPVENPPLRVSWTPRHTYIPSAPGLLGDLLVSMREALRKLDHVDVAALNQLAATDLKSVGRVLDQIEHLDLMSLTANATALLTEVRASNTKVQSFLDHTDETMQGMQLEKLARNVDGLVTRLQATVGELEPNLANLDFDALNQTLANARRTMRDLDGVLLDLKEYPSGFLFGKPPAALKAVQPSPMK